jgi:hypothetical protein
MRLSLPLAPAQYERQQKNEDHAGGDADQFGMLHGSLLLKRQQAFRFGPAIFRD